MLVRPWVATVSLKLQTIGKKMKLNNEQKPFADLQQLKCFASVFYVLEGISRQTGQSKLHSSDGRKILFEGDFES